MSQDNPGILHDATNSWNGYNHQGKIALYYAVKKITELIKDGADQEVNKTALKTHFLEVEYTEDFSIGTIGAGGELHYQTIHQVKDRQDTALSKYESAIQGLAVNMVRHPEVEAAYLHVTTNISTVKKDTPFTESVEAMIKNTGWIDEREREAKKETDAAKRQQELDWLQKVRENLPTIWQDAEKLKKIQKYPYEMPDGKPRYYCPEDAAKDYVCMSLRDFYGKHDPDKAYMQGGDFISKSYQYVLEKLNEHVVFRSLHYSDKKVQRYLPLSDLYDWLVSNEIEKMGEDYYLYHIKEGYFGYLDAFCTGCTLAQCETCQVPAFKGRFRCMKAKDLSDFVHQTNPNVPGTITIEQYHKFLQQNGIRDPFWNGLRRISQKPEEFQKSNTVKYLGSDNQTYVLTTLATSASVEDDEDEDLAWKEVAEEIKTICTEIYKNQTEHGLHLDGTVLLSKNFEVASVKDSALTINPSDMFCDPNHIATSGSVGIVQVKNFRKNYMRKEHE